MNITQYLQNFKKFSTHQQKSQPVQQFLDSINENILFAMMSRYFYDTVWALRNYYVKQWIQVFPNVINSLLQIRNVKYHSLIRDIIELTLDKNSLVQQLNLTHYIYYDLEINALIKLGPTIIPFLIQSQQLDQILELIETKQLSLNINIMIFNEYATYLGQNPTYLQEIYTLSIERQMFRLTGTCLLINRLSNKKLTKQSSDNGFLGDEIQFYQDYQETVKYWEGKYEFEPLRAPGLQIDETMDFPEVGLSNEVLKTYEQKILFEFDQFIQKLYVDLVNLQPIKYEQLKVIIIQYGILLKFVDLESISESLASVFVFLIPEVYQLNEEEAKARSKEKVYENIALVQSQYQYFSKSNTPFILPDLTYIKISQTDPKFKEELEQSIQILQGRTLQTKDKEVLKDSQQGFSQVFEQTANPHQLFKIPANKQLLHVLSALSKLIFINIYGYEMLDKMDISVGMVRFIIASIFQNENYNNKLREKTIYKLDFQQEVKSVNYIVYPAAVKSSIFSQLNTALNISNSYPLTLLDFKTSIQPLPRIKKVDRFVDNLSMINSNTGYELLGLYEHSSLTLHQFCNPFILKGFVLANLFSVLKSSSCVIIYLFQPSLSLFLYNAVTQTEKRELGVTVYQQLLEQIQNNPLLCKQQPVLLLLRSFCIAGQVMISRNLELDFDIAQFINLFISLVPITELALLTMSVSAFCCEGQIEGQDNQSQIFTNPSRILDLQFNNQYQVTEDNLIRLNNTVEFMLSCRDFYLQKLENLTPTDFQLDILTNQLLLFRFSSQILKKQLLATSSIIFSKVTPTITVSRQDIKNQINSRKQQLISFLFQVQDFATLSNFTDPRIMTLDKNLLYFMEIRNDYYSERIHKTGNKLVHCYQDQVLRLQNQAFEEFEQNSEDLFVEEKYDRLAVGMKLCGYEEAFGSQFFCANCTELYADQGK